MGARVSTQNEGKARSDAIDRQIKQESRNCRKVNILLLGSDPERSMVVKQMKIQHGLTDSELMHYRLTIYQNSIDNAQALVRAIRNMGIGYANHINNVKADRILDYRIQRTPSFVFSPEIAEAIHQLWQDPIIPKVMDRRNKIYLREGADYFFREILRIGSPDYVPTDSDILQAQDMSQLIETCFTSHALRIAIIENGVRNSVGKWIHCFEGVTCILFCVSLSDYDQVLQEDDCQNKLNDSIMLFDSVVNSRWFVRTSVILLLTGIDAFTDMLPEVPLERYFPEYAGGADVNKAVRYILYRFMQVNQARLSIFPHVHTATDQTTLRLLFTTVKETTLTNVWKDLGYAPSPSTAMGILPLR